MKKYYARPNQLLTDHLAGVEKMGCLFGEVFGVGYTTSVACRFHDLGKFTKDFRDYLQRSINGENATRGEVIHALQGARHVLEYIHNIVMSDIIGNVIASHHGGLLDSISEDGERLLKSRVQKPEDSLHYEESKTEAEKEISLKMDEQELQKEIFGFIKQCVEKKLNPCFMLHLLTKVIFSCLVDADRCDSAGIAGDIAVSDWDVLSKQLNSHLEGFPSKSPLDSIRRSISEQCWKNGMREQGIYTLSVPTGGGKTLSSLRFALEHAKKHRLKRIIYVIPYLSILDQTAENIRAALGDENDHLILEHHSNIEFPAKEDEKEQDDAEARYKLLTSRWDSPIILTTMVQFLETIFSNKASKLRKFHNMSEAVLIFDEIQSLPIKCIHLFNDAVNFLSTFGRSTVLLCTATQPHLDKAERPVHLSTDPALVSLTPEEVNVFTRVRVDDGTQASMNYEQIAALAEQQLDRDKSTLVILNTKADARAVFEKCNEFDGEKAFLTTDLCPAHRMDVLDRLRCALDAKRPTLCVSTQLIEAGVDISFACVIRAKAGLDSIVQAAGRCNRNAEIPVPQTVFVVDVKDEKLSRLPEIADGKGKTARVIDETNGENLLDTAALNLFYKYYFCEQKNKMDYVIEWDKRGNSKSTIYNLLNDNPLGTQAYKNRNGERYQGVPAAFQTAAAAFSVIDGGQIGIVVPYGEAQQLVLAFEKTFDPKERIRILKKLQRYTVSVYSYVLQKLFDAHAIRAVDETFYFLASIWYDADEFGLLSEPKILKPW
ncbi:MAG: CRISPR-associated helicase Cas3' [Burkholderiales bacterium]|jgi:CRISPR-associated endonuclease/helicase Cas3|nr:CRISPR-associated helicase Cas3' [Burkholderiales bacterium]